MEITNAQQLHSYLTSYLKGQDEPLRTICSCVWQNGQRIRYNRGREKSERIKKEITLVMGNTGCGKTYTWELIREKAPFPVTIVNAMQFSPSSWKGEDMNNIVQAVVDEHTDRYRAIWAKGSRREPFEKYFGDIVANSIIVLDEFDKCRMGGQNNLDWERSYQFQLLKIIEGTNVNVKINDFTYTISTKDMGFVLMGAFDGMDRILEEKAEIGFSGRTRRVRSVPDDEDLIRYGFIRELVGRISLRCRYAPMTEENLYDILRSGKNSALEESRRLLEFSGARLKVEDGAVRALARRAIAKNEGARAAKSVISQLLAPACFSLEKDQTVTITDDLRCVVSSGGPGTVYKAPQIRQEDDRTADKKTEEKKVEHKKAEDARTEDKKAAAAAPEKAPSKLKAESIPAWVHRDIRRIIADLDSSCVGLFAVARPSVEERAAKIRSYLAQKQSDGLLSSLQASAVEERYLG